MFKFSPRRLMIDWLPAVPVQLFTYSPATWPCKIFSRAPVFVNGTLSKTNVSCAWLICSVHTDVNRTTINFNMSFGKKSIFARAIGHDIHEHFIAIQLLALIFSVARSEEHTSELQSRENLVCRLLLEK